MMKRKQTSKFKIDISLSRNRKAKLRMNSKTVQWYKSIRYLFFLHEVGAFLRIRIMHTHSTQEHICTHTYINTCLISMLMFIFQCSTVFENVHYLLYLIPAKPFHSHLCVESTNRNGLLWSLSFGDSTLITVGRRCMYESY